MFRGLNFTVRSRVSLGSGTKAFARLRYVAQRWQPCVATLKESSCSKAAELLETRIKIFGDAFIEKAFRSVRAPLNRGVDSVKISRGDVPPLNSNSNETSTTFFEKRFNKKFR